MFFNNGDDREEFAMNEHYVGPARNRPAPSFRVGIDCHKGYMVLIQAGDEEHPKPIWLVNHCLHPILFELAQLLLNWSGILPSKHTKYQNMLYNYLGYDTKKGFKWIVNSAYGLVWINTNTILCAWQMHKGSKLKRMTIPKKTYRFCQSQLGTY